MTVSQPPAREAAFFRSRAEVKLAWGVDLHTSRAGELHESIAESITEAEVTGPFADRPDLDAVVGTEQHGPGFDGNLLVIKRTVTWAGDGLEEVTTEKIAPPTQAETGAVHAALDYLGYTGPRDIRLLLAVDYS
jgi:hypothetical protein